MERKTVLGLRMMGIVFAIGGLVCLLLKLYGRFERLCGQITEEDDEDLGDII